VNRDIYIPLVSVLVLLAIAPGATQQSLPADRSSAGVRTPLAFATPLTRDARSGEVHEYRWTATGGDLVSGTVTMRGVAALVQVTDGTGRSVKSGYVNPSGTARLGFVPATTGEHVLQVRVVDRFTSGPQVSPGEPVPVVGTASGSYTLQLDVAAVTARMSGVETAAREDYPSARLRRLAEDLLQGRSDAVQSFWREIDGKGPILEPVTGNDRDVDVTFLWRQRYDTRNVLLVWGPYQEQMSHLAGTDAWYKTVRLRRGTRIEYVFSPNDRASSRWATTQLDPLNPRKFPDDPTYRYYSQSVLDMPGAPDEQWALRTPTRRGTIQEKRVESTLLKGDDSVWVYTPPGYSPASGPYPLVILLDGAVYVSDRFVAAPTTLDNLINDGRIRSAVVCFDPRNRGPNRAAVPSLETFGEAIVKELLPMLRASYAISTDPADVVIGGFSAGARAAAHIALQYPAAFGNVLAQSGAFRAPVDQDEPNASARIFLAAPRASVRFYMEVGLYDNVPAANRPLYEMALDETNLVGNRHLRDVLLAKGYDVTYREVGGGHDFLHWRSMLADGLATLLKR
jgi:enterochelin esterase-like enzyme